MSDSDAAGLGWYARRLSRMSPAEVAWRVREKALHETWSRRQVRTAGLAGLEETRLVVKDDRRFSAVLPPGSADLIPDEARTGIVEAADRLMCGEWEVLGVARTDMARPDWFRDPVTGRRSDAERYAFRINQRAEEQVGNVKQVWEVNRLQHLTLLATAWYLTGEDSYAERVAEQLRSWWQENPFLSGVNWTSGIEVGIRLINFTWIRRLLDEWPKIGDLFERNDLALRQIRWHQQYLAAFESRGSSANNHVIAEAAGQLAASCAFPWFRESSRWRKQSAKLLERELANNTFPSGINRELASDYHGFVAELGYFAALEAVAAGFPLSDPSWRLLCAMTDAMTALMDSHGQPPRQADSDEGRVVLLDFPAHNRWPELQAIGAALFGELSWWTATPVNAGSVLAGALAGGPRLVPGRPDRRPVRFADAGITLLRTTSADPEIWCRCDGGPHGFLSIAAHAHADALSVEVRYGGVDVLADPGTYCYHGEPEWRSYFRSTIAHNTVELAGQNQSSVGGPFLWVRHARAREIGVADDGSVASWSAEHDGYRSLNPPALHRRTVRLDRVSRGIDIVDEIQGGDHDVRLAFHMGPAVHAELRDCSAVLSWPAPAVPPVPSSPPAAAWLELPPGLQWSLHRGETDPILGWYSHGLGRRVPAFTLVGRGVAVLGKPLVTRLVFLELGQFAQSSHSTASRIVSATDGERAQEGLAGGLRISPWC
jgi:Heparinase II/III-like protein/Heparinase II/III N-terminus